MIAKWLSDTVVAFGGLLGLKTFALNERGVAGVKFENGTTFRLEVEGDRLMFCLGLALETLRPEQAVRLLGEAHPFFKTSFGRIRSAYVERTQEAMLTLALPAESADAATLDRAFHELWDRGERVRRALWA